MALASTSTVELTYTPEDTFGVPDNTHTTTKLRYTGESLSYSIEKRSSDEINATGQISSAAPVSATAGGAVNIELCAREYDWFLQGLLRNTFVVPTVNAVSWTGGVLTCAVTGTAASSSTVTAVAGTLFSGIVSGQWISIHSAGGIGTYNTGIYRVESRTDSVLTFDTDTPLTSSMTSTGISMGTARLTVGTSALTSWTLEKNFTDITKFHTFKGMVPSKLDLSFQTGSLLTGSLTFMGKDASLQANTLVNTAGNATSTGVMNAVTGLKSSIGVVMIGGNVVSGMYVKSMNVSIDSGNRAQDAIGYLGAIGIGKGTFNITGTIEIYFTDSTMYDYALYNTTISIMFPVADETNHGYAFIFNNVKLDVPTINAGAKDQDVMQSFGFRAIAPNTSTDSMIIIDRFGATT